MDLAWFRYVNGRCLGLDFAVGWWYAGGMWVARQAWERHKARSEQLDAVVEQARKRVAREIRARCDAEQRCADLVAVMSERIVTLANRPPHVLQPPDTAAIVKTTVEGMATVLNGWKDQPQPTPAVQTQLSMDMQGLDDRAGVPQSLQDFRPPWEEGFPEPDRAGFVNATIGNYKPYVPGEGNTTQPKGGFE